MSRGLNAVGGNNTAIQLGGANNADAPQRTSKWQAFKTALSNAWSKVTAFFSAVGQKFVELKNRIASLGIPGTAINHADSMAKLNETVDAVANKLTQENFNPLLEGGNTLFRLTSVNAQTGASSGRLAGDFSKPFMEGLGKDIVKIAKDVFKDHKVDGRVPELEIDPTKPNGPQSQAEINERVAILTEAYNAILDRVIGGNPNVEGYHPDSVPQPVSCEVHRLKELVFSRLPWAENADRTPEQQQVESQIERKIVAHVVALTTLAPALVLEGARVGTEDPGTGAGLKYLSKLFQNQFNNIEPGREGMKEPQMGVFGDAFRDNRGRVDAFISSIPTAGRAYAEAGTTDTTIVGRLEIKPNNTVWTE